MHNEIRQSARVKNDAGKVTVRLYMSSDVIEALKAVGPDWEEQANETLRQKFMAK